jgi:L-aspartate oxidase
MKARTSVLELDALVLGAGLAGLRAAWAALERGRELGRPLRALVVGMGAGPSGSSFANRNGRLGMQFFRDPEVGEIFVRRALEIGAPGLVDPLLARRMAAESAERFDELRGLGLRFRLVPGGGRLERVPGCFLPELSTAAVLDDLPGAYHALGARCRELGGEFLFGWSAVDLLRDEHGAVAGALLARSDPGSDERLAASARSVILALGGPASLFARDVSGPGGSGHGYGLLRRAGARVANTGFLQWMWHEVGPTGAGRFFPLQELERGGVRDARGVRVPLPEELAALCPERGTHCPFGHGLKDARLDLFLAERLGADGTVQVWRPERGAVRIAPHAHAGNGGALVDANGATSVPGLFACGECATGMHGANRVGGAMILATQVFGRAAGRAGAERVMEAAGAVREAAPLRPALAQTERGRDAQGLAWLRQGLQREALLGGGPGLAAFASELRERAESARHWDQALDLESGLLVVEGLLP